MLEKVMDGAFHAISNIISVNFTLVLGILFRLRRVPIKLANVELLLQ